jgi:hypothetical protein
MLPLRCNTCVLRTYAALMYLSHDKRYTLTQVKARRSKPETGFKADCNSEQKE